MKIMPMGRFNPLISNLMATHLSLLSRSRHGDFHTMYAETKGDIGWMRLALAVWIVWLLVQGIAFAGFSDGGP